MCVELADSSIPRVAMASREGVGIVAATAAAAPAAPPSAALPLTEEDLATAVRVIEVVSADAALLASKPLRTLRKALAPLVSAAQQRMFGGGMSEADYDAKRREHTAAANRRNLDRLRDQDYINKTRLRAARLAKLAELSQQGGTEEHPTLPLIPDGCVDEDGLVVHGLEDRPAEGWGPAASSGARKRALLLEGNSAGEQGAGDAGGRREEGAESGGARKRALVEEPLAEGVAGGGAGEGVDADAAAAPARQLLSARACYICKVRFSALHHFYDTLCPACASLNWAKRNQTAVMNGRYALVTGARVKIGFQAALRLLRCGATVFATSRFPRDAAQRFASAPDFEAWRDRLHVYALDLRDMRTLEAFCDMLLACAPRLDAIVNNACQTVRRPPAYYAALAAGEHGEVQQPRLCQLLAADAAFRSGLAAGAAASAPISRRLLQGGASTCSSGGGSSTGLGGWSAEGGPESQAQQSSDAEGAALHSLTSLPCRGVAGAAGVEDDGGGNPPPPSSALASQGPLLRGDRAPEGQLAASFPSGRVDVNAQQLDLRSRNSWTMRLEEIETPELAEVFFINSMAPMVLNGRLKPLMMRGRVVPDPLPTHPPRESAARKLKSLAEVMLEQQEQLSRGDEPPLQQSGGVGGAGRASGNGAARRDAKMRNGGPLLGEVAPPVPAELCRFIVNVSAMEGKFHRHKTANHPHTNAAKAALNMMTRTSAQDYARDFIYMTSVDTGARGCGRWQILSDRVSALA